MYNFELQTDLQGKVKPCYVDGQPVMFTMGPVSGTGVICGLASRHLLDMWIVKVTTALGVDKETYPWSCLVVPHNGITPIEVTVPGVNQPKPFDCSVR